MSESQQSGGSLWSRIKLILYLVIGAYIVINVFFKKDSPAEYVAEEVIEPNEGIITKVKEIENDLFKITDEDVVPLKEDSRIIATYMTGQIDTFTLDEARLEDASDPKRSIMRSVLYASAIGYMMGRPMSSPVSRGAYADDRTFNKAQQNTNRIKSSGTRRTVSRPSSGYGSGKSTRSYGG